MSKKLQNELFFLANWNERQYFLRYLEIMMLLLSRVCPTLLLEWVKEDGNGLVLREVYLFVKIYYG